MKAAWSQALDSPIFLEDGLWWRQTGVAPGSAPSQLPPQPGQGQLTQEKKALAQAVLVKESLPRAHKHAELRRPGSVPWKSPGAPTTALVLPPPGSALSILQNPSCKSDFYYVGQS